LVAFLEMICYTLLGDNMKCENVFCIYESDGICTLDEIELDILGQCTECIYATLDDETLRIAKEKTLRNIEN